MTRLDAAWDRYVALVDQEQARNQRHPGQYPHYTENGRWVRLSIDATSGWVDEKFYDHGNWTAGFSAGQVWLARNGVGEPARVADEQRSVLQDVAKRAEDKTTHDLGFLFHPSFVLGRQLGYLEQPDVAPAITAARSLAERFNPRGGYLQAFGSLTDARSRSTSTIDTMMNLPLLWWAAAVTGEEELHSRAVAHATASATNLFRPDGSTYHLIRYDPETGDVVAKGTFQGATDASCWSRGQAWAIAGFALSYAETGRRGFAEVARRAWDYFAARIPDDAVVPYDFSLPDDPVRDASASAIAALGALVLSETADGGRQSSQGRVLRDEAVSVLASLDEHAVRRDADCDGVLLRSCYSKPHGRGLSGALPYGDFYYGLALALASGQVPLDRILANRGAGPSMLAEHSGGRPGSP
jgi:unsaturated chondroitin disaccharide hydrolase